MTTITKGNDRFGAKLPGVGQRIASSEKKAADKIKQRQEARQAGKREGMNKVNEAAKAAVTKPNRSRGSKEKTAHGISFSANRFDHGTMDVETQASSEQDAGHIDVLDGYAVRLLDMIHGGLYSTALLSKQELCILYRYFFRTNPILGRIIDLHTDLPLSKIAINPPADLPEIVKDYITQWYQKVLDRIDMPALIRQATIHYWVYGESNLLVSDHYDDSRVLEKLPSTAQVNQNLADLSKIENDYSTDPQKVNMSDRLNYLKSKFEGFFNQEYEGPSSARVIPFWEVDQYLENPDISYKSLTLLVPENIRNLKGSKDVTFQNLEDLGYSRGLLNLLAVTPASSPDAIFQPKDGDFTVTNELYQKDAFIFSMERPDRTSIIHRVLNECIAWDAAYKALRAKIRSIGKIGRVITAPDLSTDQLDYLRAEVEQMIEDPSFAIIANYEINWDEVNSFVKEELKELADATEGLKELLSLATGMPLSMLSGEGQYSGDSVKLEIINTVYSSFKNNLIKAVEQGLFLPMALRKGFVTQDQWGVPTPVFPRFALSRVSLRDDNVFDILFSLYQKGSAPAALIYDLLGMDADEVRRAVEKEAFTINDPNFNQFLQDLYSRSADEFYERVDIPEKIATGIGILLKKRTAPATPPEQE